MLQPTNPSFVHAVAEASLDRHFNETEEDAVLRQGQPYHEPELPRWVGQLLRRVGQCLVDMGTRLSDASRHADSPPPPLEAPPIQGQP